MRGEERGAGEMEGETAGSMLGDTTMEALLGPGAVEAALRDETSEDVLLRPV